MVVSNDIIGGFEGKSDKCNVCNIFAFEFSNYNVQWDIYRNDHDGNSTFVRFAYVCIPKIVQFRIRVGLELARFEPGSIGATVASL